MNTPAPKSQNQSPDQIRMRGFAKRHPVVQAIEWIDAQSQTMPTEFVPIKNASGRVLSQPICSPMDVPAFDRSAMDGYALIAEKTIGATEAVPIPFQMTGQSFPGNDPTSCVTAQTCVKIMTGAPIPQGADAVVPVEFTEAEAETIHVQQAMPRLKHVSKIGEDVRKDQKIFSEKQALRAQDLAMLAALGIPEVNVIQQPKVRIILSGNELVTPGKPRSKYQIFEANSYLLNSLVPRDGGVIESIQFVKDEPAEIRKALQEPGADVILVSGGTSVGQEDFVPEVVNDLGELAIHGIAMRPASPTGMGKIGNSLVFLLPGNPVSCLCGYDFFAGRAIRTLAGYSPDWPHRRIQGRLEQKISSAVGRTDYCRVSISPSKTEDSPANIIPLAISGASILSTTVLADGFVIIPENLEGYPIGHELAAYMYE